MQNLSFKENMEGNKGITGYVKVWKIDKSSGAKELVVDQKNLVLNGGATVLSYALSGKLNSNIWGFYIGYNNNESFTPPVIDTAYTNKFQALSSSAGFNYLREPLTFSPSYMSTEGYVDNVALFSVLVSASNGVKTGISDPQFIGGVSNIYEVALVASPNPNDHSSDIVFSRTNFSPIQYDSSSALAITWGIKFLVE